MMTVLSLRSRSRYLKAVLAAAVGLGLTPSLLRAVNIAPEGTGIIGVHTGALPTLGTPFEHAGLAFNVNDGDPLTPVDTWNGNSFVTTHSYVGVVFGTPRLDLITSLTLDVAAFFDGGWFGPNGVGPGASGQLSLAHLIAPTLQSTVDGGNTWVDVSATNNYTTALDGVFLPVSFGPPSHGIATFTPDVPLTGVNGVRLIGPEGGQASNGFLGVFELGIEASPIPEPSAMLLAAAIGSGLALRRRRHR